MDDYLPSEVARLVLGYLKEVNCMKSWNTFLEESPSLREYYFLYNNGKIYSTNVNEKSLSEILSFYRSLKKYGEKIVNEIKRCEKEYSSDPDTRKDILEEIVNIVSLTFQKYSSSNNENLMRTPTSDGIVGIIYSESKAKINDLSENIETSCSNVIHQNNDETLPNISEVYSLSNVNSSSLSFFQNLIDFNIPVIETLKDEYLENNKISNMEKSDSNLKDRCSVMNSESQVYCVTNERSFVNNNNSVKNHRLENCGDNFIIVPESCASIEAKSPDTEMSQINVLENINNLAVPILSDSYNMASSDEMVTNLNNENHLVKENIGCSNVKSSEKSLSCKNPEIDANNNLQFNHLSYNNQDIFGGIFNYENKLGSLNNEIGSAIAFNAHQLATMNTLPIPIIPTCVLAGGSLMQSTIPYNYVMNASCSGLSLPVTDTSNNIQNINSATTDTLKYGETMLTLSTPFSGDILALPNGQPVTTNFIGEKDFKKADKTSVRKSKKKTEKLTDKSKKIKTNEFMSSEEHNYSKCTSKRQFLCLLPCTPEKNKEVAVTSTSVCDTAISEVAASAFKLFSLITGQNEDCNIPVSTAKHEIQNESQVISTKNKSINKIDKSKGNVIQSYYQKGNLNKSDALKSNNKSNKSKKQTIRKLYDVANNDVLENNKLKYNVSYSNHQTRDLNRSQDSYSKVEFQKNTMVQFHDKIKTYLKQKKVPQNSKEVNSLKKLVNEKLSQAKKILPKNNEGFTQDKNDVTSQKKKQCTRLKTKSQEENIVSENSYSSICKNDFPKKCPPEEIAIYSIKEKCKNSKSKKSSSKDQSKSDVNNEHLKKNGKYENLKLFCKSSGNSIIQKEKNNYKHCSCNLSSDLNSVLEDKPSKAVFHTTEGDCILKQTETSKVKDIPNDPESTRLSTLNNSAESLLETEFDNASNKCHSDVFTFHSADVVTETESMVQNLSQNYFKLICDEEKSKFETEKENDTSLITYAKKDVFHSTPKTFIENKKSARKIKLSKFSKTKNKKLSDNSLIINKPVSSFCSLSSEDRNSEIITNPPNLCQAIKSLSFHNSVENISVSGDNQCSNRSDTCDVSESFSNNIKQDVIYNDTGRKRKLDNSCDINDRLELNVSDNQFSNCNSLLITKKPNCNESDNICADNKLQSVPCVMLTKLDEHKIHSLTHTVDHNKKEKHSDSKNNCEQIKKPISQSSNESTFSCSVKLSIQNFTNICDGNLEDIVDTNEEKSGEKGNEKSLAFTSCEKQLVISQSSDNSHSSKNVCPNDIVASSEKEAFENPTVSSKKEVKTAIKVSSQWDIIQNAIEKYGYDYILSKVNDYLNC